MPVDFCDERARVGGITLPRNYDLARRAQREIESDLHGKQVGPGNEIVMGADGLAAGELREGEAFGPVLDHFGANRTRLGLEGAEPDPYPSATELAAGSALSLSSFSRSRMLESFPAPLKYPPRSASQNNRSCVS